MEESSYQTIVLDVLGQHVSHMTRIREFILLRQVSVVQSVIIGSIQMDTTGYLRQAVDKLDPHGCNKQSPPYDAP